MAAPSYWKRATRELAQRDTVIKKIAAKASALAVNSRGDAFNTLARAIVGQQLSVKAAQSIWQRLADSVAKVCPETIHTHDIEVMRSCGLSRSKVNYLQNLARHFIERKLNIQRWNELPDEDLIAELTQVKGIGRWTAEMFLIFYMNRPDVLPVDDVGLQRAVSLHYNNGRPVSKLKMTAIAKRWIPWRSVATWYLWRSLEPSPVKY